MDLRGLGTSDTQFLSSHHLKRFSWERRYAVAISLTRTWLTLLPAILLLAACGGDEGDDAVSDPDRGGADVAITSMPDGPASQVDPCSLLTNEEVASVIGRKVDDVNQDVGSPASCAYTFVQPSGIPAGNLAISVDVSRGAKDVFEGGKKLKDGNQPVSGVGDDTYWSPLYKQLSVLSNGIYLSVHFVLIEPATVDKARELALQAESLLP